MKTEQSEQILVEELFKKTIHRKLLDDGLIESLEKLTGDASTRKYYRVWTSMNSYVVCLDTPSGGDFGESSFLKLQNILKSEKVRVPEIYDKELATGYILEEDLGDRTFLKELALIEDLSQEYEYYAKAIDGMSLIHKIDIKKYGNEAFTKLAFDTEKLYSEMEFTKKYFLKMYLGADVKGPGVEILYKRLYDLCFSISSEPRAVVHRDYHSRNIMIKGDEQVIIDFQDARLGTPVYDLVSLLEDCYYQIGNENKDKLKRYYFEKYFKDFDNAKTYEQYLELYNQVAIQRVFKAIGSFAFIYAERRDVRYLKYIGFAFEKLRELMFKIQNFSDERKIIASLFYGN